MPAIRWAIRCVRKGRVQPLEVTRMDTELTPQGENTAEAQATAQDQQTPAAPAAAETDWKAQSRKWEQRAKENLAAAEKLAQLEEQNKSEAEKAADRLAKLEAENNALKLEKQQSQWRDEVAETTGMPASVLRGSTLEEIEAHAESLKSAFQVAAKQDPKDPPVPTVGQTPQTPGNVPLREQIAAAEKAGDRDLVAALKAAQLGALSA